MNCSYTQMLQLTSLWQQVGIRTPHACKLFLIIWFKVQQTFNLREVYYFIFHFILSNIQSVKQKLIYLLKPKYSAN